MPLIGFASYLTLLVLSLMQGQLLYNLYKLVLDFDKPASKNLIPLDLSIYMGSIALAHLGEFLFVARYHTKQLKWKSFLIDQSREYMLAHTFAFVEYLIDWVLSFILGVDIYDYKSFTIITHVSFVIGLLMISVGHLFRIGAMFTAA